MPVDPELAAALAAMPRLPTNGKLLDFTDIPRFRAMMAAVPQPSATEIDDPRVEVRSSGPNEATEPCSTSSFTARPAGRDRCPPCSGSTPEPKW